MMAALSKAKEIIEILIDSGGYSSYPKSGNSVSLFSISF